MLQEKGLKSSDEYNRVKNYKKIFNVKIFKKWSICFLQ